MRKVEPVCFPSCTFGLFRSLKLIELLGIAQFSSNWPQSFYDDMIIAPVLPRNTYVEGVLHPCKPHREGVDGGATDAYFSSPDPRLLLCRVQRRTSAYPELFI